MRRRGGHEGGRHQLFVPLGTTTPVAAPKRGGCIFAANCCEPNFQEVICLGFHPSFLSPSLITVFLSSPTQRRFTLSFDISLVDEWARLSKTRALTHMAGLIRNVHRAFGNTTPLRNLSRAEH